MPTTATTEQTTSDTDRFSTEGDPRDRYVVVRFSADGGAVVSVGSVDQSRYIDLDELVIAIGGAAATGVSPTDTAIGYLLNAETWGGPDSVFGRVAAVAAGAAEAPLYRDWEIHIEGDGADV